MNKANDLSQHLADFVELIPQVSHQKSIEYLLSSDFLLLFIAKKNSEIVIPAKLFEYLAAKKPILAIMPLHGEAADLIRNLQAGYLVEIDDVKQIKKYILQLCLLAKEKKEIFQFDETKIKQYERQNQTRQLAELFNAGSK